MEADIKTTLGLLGDADNRISLGLLAYPMFYISLFYQGLKRLRFYRRGVNSTAR